MGVSSGFPGWFFGDLQGDSWGLLEAFPEGPRERGSSGFPGGPLGLPRGFFGDPWGELWKGPSGLPEAFSEGEVGGVPRRVFRVTSGRAPVPYSGGGEFGPHNRQHAIYCLPRRVRSVGKGRPSCVCR